MGLSENPHQNITQVGLSEITHQNITQVGLSENAQQNIARFTSMCVLISFEDMMVII